jgi:hypothetical protein
MDKNRHFVHTLHRNFIFGKLHKFLYVLRRCLTVKLNLVKSEMCKKQAFFIKNPLFQLKSLKNACS